MKYTGFDGRTYSIHVTDYTVYDDSTISKSELHLRARKLIKSIFPCDKILEEVTLPGSKKSGERLFADFFIPSKSLIIEVHGEQHYKYVKFFHGDNLSFIKSRLRDNDKKEWAEINNITIVELPYNQTDIEWKEKIELR